MSATWASFELPKPPPDTRTPAQKAAEMREWKREQERADKERTAEMFAAASGFHGLVGRTVVAVEFARPKTSAEYDWYDNGYVLLTLDDGRVAKIGTKSFDYDGEDSMPVLEGL